MDNKPGGQRNDAQKRAAADIARNRVLAAYGKRPENFTVDLPNVGGKGMLTVPRGESETVRPVRPRASAKEKVERAAPQSMLETRKKIEPKVDRRQWAKYHEAWQDYYQKYYEGYYATAAKSYIASEEVKMAYSSGKKRLPGDELAERELKAREKIRLKASERAQKIRRSRHFAPAVVVLVIALTFVFVQYNRVVFAPLISFISPGNVLATEVAEIDATISLDVGPDPKLIIPKLNIDVPVHFGISNDKATVNAAMQNGIAQFAVPGASAMPGQNGNLALSGHSAGDVYDSGNRFRFIFSGLERLVADDTIFINYESKRFVYRVTESRVVEPTDVSALYLPEDRPYLTLITCTPLGTSRFRLLVFAEQISPAPSDEHGSSSGVELRPDEGQTELPSNPRTFFEGVWNFLIGRTD
jgi:sortase A